MKFTKEQAYKDLVARLTAKGEKLNLSERSINEQLEKLIELVANEETELTDFLDKTLPIFKTADANVRNDVSAGIKEYKELNPVPLTPPTPPTPPTPNTDDELKKRLEELEKKLADDERKKTLNEVRSKLVSTIKEKGVKDDEWINAIINEVNVTEDCDVTTKADHYVDIYNKMNARVQANVTPTPPSGGNIDLKRMKEVIASAGLAAKADRGE